MMVGSGGTAGSSPKQRGWKRYPEKWEMRGMITRSGIQPRSCRLVRWMDSVSH
jgi:hypothetical protein